MSGGDDQCEGLQRMQFHAGREGGGEEGLLKKSFPSFLDCEGPTYHIQNNNRASNAVAATAERLLKSVLSLLSTR